MSKPLPPPFEPAPFDAPVQRVSQPKSANAYEAERDRAAAKVIMASMDKRLYGKTFPSQTESDHDPHQW